MESVPLRRIRALMEVYDQKLLATDERFYRKVKLIHQDGSTMWYENSFLLSVELEWIVCFTEHHGFHIYHIDDLYSFNEYEVRKLPIEEYHD